MNDILQKISLNLLEVAHDYEGKYGTTDEGRERLLEIEGELWNRVVEPETEGAQS